MLDPEAFPGYKALYHTFGCKLNFAETSTVARMLSEKGIRRVQQGEVPDIVVVNTCSVTEMADKKCRQTIRSFAKRYPDAAIVVTGCYAQLKSGEVAAIPGVDIVAGTDQKLALVDYIDSWLSETCRSRRMEVTPTRDIRQFRPSCSGEDRTRYFLKVQDGCDYWCTYCTIPMARGRSRSGTIPELVAQARRVAEEGGREIVLTGVNVGDFGKGRDDTFFDLIQALDRVDGIERFRISSIEPNLLTEEIIDWVAGSRHFMPHFHVPLQAGSDEVLKLMHRRYGTDLFRSRIEHIKKAMPHAFVGVDLIVGARGETDRLFRQSYDFVESLPISRLHVFPYSERLGTRALEIDNPVAQEEKHRRTQIMLRLSERKLADFTSQFLGTVRRVLPEQLRDDHPMGGFTDNYLRVIIPPRPELANKIINVRLDSVADEVEQTINATIIEND
ncbi:MAG: tRNA (N(6)-L-threonylcarbamoyladenosine(37)-C(2))-methylthiotransferase MtaB [Muribaculum sp.]|nr:tRNA (N(6)-L-threonylcarbamoyladenosine(37)-C(2))-methylthiotransferase MtaB [Muribaculaceae bacterium]MCM1080228.1 tRNA (N(6)-L-threonylcarbamoyladenosine(37)-C(2))-methylthiotransferase MtaB [Muribaculum sp.]